MPDHDPAQVVIEKLTRKEPYRTSTDWNHAHRAGATCPRELAYWRLYPERALPEDPELSIIFRHGYWMEREAVGQLVDAGYEVSEQDAAFEWRDMRLRGRIDCKIRINGAKRPVEIKGYSPLMWDRLNRIEDFLESDKEYLRRVPGQLLSYILLDGSSEWAMLYMINKVTGKPKTIRLALEGKTLEWGEAMLKRLQVVNAAVEKKELPERIEYDDSVCGVCPFRGDCLKDIPAGKDLTVLDPEKAQDLLELLEERAALMAAHKRFEVVDREIAKRVKGIERLVVGDWLITGKEVAVKEYTVKARTDWRKTITNLKAPQKPDED